MRVGCIGVWHWARGQRRSSLLASFSVWLLHFTSLSSYHRKVEDNLAKKYRRHASLSFTVLVSIIPSSFSAKRLCSLSHSSYGYKGGAVDGLFEFLFFLDVRLDLCFLALFFSFSCLFGLRYLPSSLTTTASYHTLIIIVIQH